MTAAPRPFRWKRFTLYLGAFVLCSALGGLITTVAVAWGLAAWLPHRGFVTRDQRWPPPQHGNDMLLAQEFSRPGMVRRTWDYLSLDGLPAGPLLDLDFFRSARRGEDHCDETWGRLPLALRDEEGAPRYGMEDARGWPRLALWCEFDLKRTRVWSASAVGGLPLFSSASTPLADFRALPYRPIYRGLLIDTAAYAPAWAVLLALARFRPLRRALRRRRHQCPACGYDLRGLAPGSACPECGPQS